MTSYPDRRIKTAIHLGLGADKHHKLTFGKFTRQRIQCVLGINRQYLIKRIFLQAFLTNDYEGKIANPRAPIDRSNIFLGFKQFVI